MHKRTRPVLFEEKPYYTITDLLVYTRHMYSWKQMKRLLVGEKVEFKKVGRSLYIPKEELRMKAPELWSFIYRRQ